MIKTTKSEHAIIRNKLNDKVKIISKHSCPLWDINYKKYLPEDDTYFWISKPIKDLIGKYTVRSKPFIHVNGMEDYSYIDEIIKIINVKKDGAILYQTHYVDDIFELDKSWDDNNWVNVPKEYYGNSW